VSLPTWRSILLWLPTYLWLLFVPKLTLALDASSLPFDISKYTNSVDLIGDTKARIIVQTVGLITQHRPYEPATPLGLLLGLDASVEVTMVQFPTEFKSTIKAAGLTSIDNLPPAVPIPKLHIHKGVLPMVDLGASAFRYQSYTIYGGDLKVGVYVPEEGPTFAVRLCYTQSKLGYVTTKTWTPQMIMSRQLSFADPYVGIGGQFVSGEIKITQDILGYTLTLKKESHASSADAFLGVAFKFGPLPLRIVLEGAYNTAKVNTMGVKFGVKL